MKLTPQQEKYANNAHLRKGLQEHCRNALKKAEKEYLAQNPQLQGVSVRGSLNVVNAQPKGITKAILAIVDLMIFDKTRKRTQKSILDEVRPNFPHLYLYPAVWQKDLHPGILRSIATRIKTQMPNSISIQGCKSLSDIKKKLKLETQLKEPEQIFNRKITITADSVIIGKKIYPITNRTANKYEYPSIRVTLSNGKRQWLKLDTLRALL